MIILALLHNLDALIVLIILAGLAGSGFESLAYIYNSEISGERFRNYSVVTLGTVWALGQVVIPPVFLIAHDWRWTV